MAKRGENIYKRKDGRWEARYIKARTLTGKAVYGYIYRRSYLEVKRAQSEARVNCINHKASGHCHLTSPRLDVYLALWLQSVRTSIKKSTFSNYSGLIHRHIIPVLGNLFIEQINSEVVQKYVDQKLETGRLDRQGGLSVKTVRDIVVLLKHSLKPAGIELQINMPRYSLPKLKTLTVAEQNKLVIAAKNSESRDGLGILLSLFTGIRIGELCSLKWMDIDFSERTLRISHTLQRIESWTYGDPKTVIDIGTPKSNSSVRDIPLPSFLISPLLTLKGTSNENDYILSGCNRYVEPRCCQFRFKRFIQKVGIDVNFHVLRHTFATRCVELGVDAKTISEILGHSNVNITLNRYVHPDFEHRKECMEKLSISF